MPFRPASDRPAPDSPTSNAGAGTPRDVAGRIGPAGAVDTRVLALQETVQRSGRTLWSVAAAVLGRRSDAEDVVQEAVIVALGKLDQLSKVENLAVWLAQIVRFVALNRRRADRLRHAESEAALERVPTSSTAPGAGDSAADSPVSRTGTLISAERHFDDNVLAALRGLDETPRACLLLRVLNDLSYREIGELLGIPEGTAMSHVFRARRSMLQALTEMGDSRAPKVD